MAIEKTIMTKKISDGNMEDMNRKFAEYNAGNSVPEEYASQLRDL